MRVYTFFTDSHKKLFDVFLKNFPYNVDTELNIKWFPQECREGCYMTEGWLVTMKRKVEYIIEALNETKENDWFVHCDCDVLLFEGWTNILKKQDNLDIIFQNDALELCAGFFFCKSNDKTKTLWKLVLDNLEQLTNDQVAVNYFIRVVKDLKVGVLPDTYFTYGLINKSRWDGNDFIFPNIKKIKMFHANWVTGVDQKLELLNKCLQQKHNGN